MCKSPPLEFYAEQICSSAKLIDAYCLLIGHPYPSFDPQAPNFILPSSAPLNILTARRTLITATLKIQQMATEPSEYVPLLATHFQNFACIHWLCHFRILSFIPLHGSVPYSEVATIAGVPERQLKSVVRMAMLSNFLCEPIPDEVAHSAPSALLVTRPCLLEWALFMANTTSQSAAKFFQASERWGVSEGKNHTAFNIAKNTDLQFFDYVVKTPYLRKQFSAYLQNITISEGTKLEHLLTGFDWEGLGEATIADVGGSNCDATIALATAYPSLQFIIQDLPDTITLAQARIAPYPETIRSRISFRAHDYFTTPVPVQSVDVYLLRMVLHDWPAMEASRVLRNLIPALEAKEGTRLLIMDIVLPSPGSCSPVEEAMLRVRDLTMMQLFNSSERALEDWQQLFAAIGGKLVLKATTKPFGSVMSIMELVYTADRSETSRANEAMGTEVPERTECGDASGPDWSSEARKYRAN